MVRMAVARLESMPSIPIFASMDVKAANTAERIANIHHISFIFIVCLYIATEISAIAKTEQVVAAPHLAKKNVIVEMGKLRGRLRERKSKTNRMSAAVSVPSATGKH